MNYHLTRRERLIQSLKNAGLDAFLVTNPLNVHYLTSEQIHVNGDCIRLGRPKLGRTKVLQPARVGRIKKINEVNGLD